MTTTKRLALKEARNIEEEVEALRKRLRKVDEAIDAAIDSGVEAYEIGMDAGASRKFKQIPLTQLMKLRRELLAEIRTLDDKIAALRGEDHGADTYLVRF